MGVCVCVGGWVNGCVCVRGVHVCVCMWVWCVGVCNTCVLYAYGYSVTSSAWTTETNTC